MTLTKRAAIVDGRPIYEYISDGHVLLTGPITGQVTVSDGTVYDVTPEVIEIDPAHAGEVAHHIGVRHEVEGNHPSHQPTAADPDPHPFLHTCTEHCGDVADTDRQAPVVDRLRAMGRDI